MAAAPPGIGTPARCPARSNSARSASRNSPPHRVPSVPKPVPSNATPMTGPSSSLSARHDAMCAWWCCTPTSSTSSSSRRTWWTGTPGADRRNDLRRDVEQPLEVLDALGERPQGLVVLQVPDVLGDEGPVLGAQAERAFQLGPAGQHRPREPAPQGERLGRVAARTAQQHPRPRTAGPPNRRPACGWAGRG